MSTAITNVRPADAPAIDEAAKMVACGGLVAFPTETVYGLGADATNDRAVARIFAAKSRPRFNPLIVHVKDATVAEELVTFTPLARELAGHFWPGALTLVLPRKLDSPLSSLVSAGLDTVAIRVPDHPIARSLLAAARVPIAAPSANASGEVSPTTAEHVRQSLGDKVDLILDAGPTRMGLESTVIGFDGDKPIMLRLGAIPREKIEAVVGRLGEASEATRSSPGRLASHYAPKARLRLNATQTYAGEALLGFGRATGAMLNLSETGDLEEAAANFFAMLRALDAGGPRVIAVMPIPEHDLGEAINDRLRRAAAPRENTT